eukprot:TRINITY_DN43424_c0_g1_i1.p1 TRINITY_DN43424_c0_g1~~TRINITY_DN43424_c0_g1_i1.p1  ORF type:complete len:1235 (+),score=136.24 TRINITY_DN43424_c0_g1_i1:363-4067(+)
MAESVPLFSSISASFASFRGGRLGRKVAVVSSEDDVREGACWVLQLLGCNKTLGCRDGDPAPLLAERFDVIFCDLELAGPLLDRLQASIGDKAADFTGDDSLAAAGPSAVGKGDNQLSPLVLICEKRMNRRKLNACLDAGACGYVTKPLRIQAIRGAFVRHACSVSVVGGEGDAGAGPEVTPSQGPNGADRLNGSKHYERVRALGRGAFGEVSLVHRLRDGACFALKELTTDRLSVAEQRRVLDELKLHRAFDCPLVVRYYTSWMQGDVACLLLEYVENGSLSRQVSKCKEDGSQIPDESIIHWAGQMNVALLYLHRKEVVHRDLKLDNVLGPDSHDLVKLADFGISKRLSGVLAKSIVGTPEIMSPERCAVSVGDGEAELEADSEGYGPASDMWSLGVIVYELASLRTPFAGESGLGLASQNGVSRADSIGDTGTNAFQREARLFERIRNEEPAPLPFSRAALLHKLVPGALLRKQPEDRPSAADLCRDPELGASILRFLRRHKLVEHPSILEIIDVLPHRADGRSRLESSDLDVLSFRAQGGIKGLPSMLEASSSGSSGTFLDRSRLGGSDLQNLPADIAAILGEGDDGGGGAGASGSADIKRKTEDETLVLVDVSLDAKPGVREPSCEVEKPESRQSPTSVMAKIGQMAPELDEIAALEAAVSLDGQAKDPHAHAVSVGLQGARDPWPSVEPAVGKVQSQRQLEVLHGAAAPLGLDRDRPQDLPAPPPAFLPASHLPLHSDAENVPVTADETSCKNARKEPGTSSAFTPKLALPSKTPFAGARSASADTLYRARSASRQASKRRLEPLSPWAARIDADERCTRDSSVGKSLLSPERVSNDRVRLASEASVVHRTRTPPKNKFSSSRPFSADLLSPLLQSPVTRGCAKGNGDHSSDGSGSCCNRAPPLPALPFGGAGVSHHRDGLLTRLTPQRKCGTPEQDRVRSLQQQHSEETPKSHARQAKVFRESCAANSASVDTEDCLVPRTPERKRKTQSCPRRPLDGHIFQRKALGSRESIGSPQTLVSDRSPHADDLLSERRRIPKSTDPAKQLFRMPQPRVDGERFASSQGRSATSLERVAAVVRDHTDREFRTHKKSAAGAHVDQPSFAQQLGVGVASASASSTVLLRPRSFFRSESDVTMGRHDASLGALMASPSPPPLPRRVGLAGAVEPSYSVGLTSDMHIPPGGGRGLRGGRPDPLSRAEMIAAQRRGASSDTPLLAAEVAWAKPPTPA